MAPRSRNEVLRDVLWDVLFAIVFLAMTMGLKAILFSLIGGGLLSDEEWLEIYSIHFELAFIGVAAVISANLNKRSTGIWGLLAVFSLSVVIVGVLMGFVLVPLDIDADSAEFASPEMSRIYFNNVMGLTVLFLSLYAVFRSRSNDD